MKKMLSVFLVVVLLLSLSVMAFADGENLIVKNAASGKDYHWYRLFNARATSATAQPTYHTTAEKKAIIDAMNDPEDPKYDPDCPFKVDDTELDGYGYGVTIKGGVDDDEVIDWLAKKSTTDNSVTNYALLALADAAMTNTNGTATATVDPGYYYITTSLGTAVTIDSVLGDPVVVYDKNEAPNGPEKKITGEKKLGEEELEQFDPAKDSNEAAVGSIEEFTVTFNATNYVTIGDSTEKILNWVIQDTPTNLEIIEGTVKVYVNGSETALDADEYFAAVANNKLTVNIPWVNTDPTSEDYGKHLYTPAEGEVYIPVRIVYQAEVLPGAATEVAPNAVTVSYGHVPAATPDANTPNPTNPDNPDNPTNPTDPEHPWNPTDPENPWEPTDPDTPWNPTDPDSPVPVTPLGPDETETYTYGFDLLKVFVGDTEGTKKGAKFTLSEITDLDTMATGSAIKFIEEYNDDDPDHPYYVYRVATKDEIDNEVAGLTDELYLENCNNAQIRGLDSGYYKLHEVSTADGYNTCPDMIIAPADAEEQTMEDAKYVLTVVGNAAGFAELEVDNKTGSELPTTGGIGTTIFYVLGTVLLIGAGAVLIARRKANER